MLSEGLLRLAVHYSKEGELPPLERDEAIALLQELVEFYLKDKNSSALRERVVLEIAGYSGHEGKLGYNGRTCKGRPVEVKPVNVLSSGNKKLNGGGNFTDMTYERMKKYSDDGLLMLVAGFIDGRLTYILEFPFDCIKLRIKEQLDKKFHGSRPEGMFLRSASFNYKHYAGCDSVRLLFYSKEMAEKHSHLLTKGFREFLKSLEESRG